jgi:hypothetical protein
VETWPSSWSIAYVCLHAAHHCAILPLVHFAVCWMHQVLSPGGHFHQLLHVLFFCCCYHLQGYEIQLADVADMDSVSTGRAWVAHCSKQSALHQHPWPACCQYLQQCFCRVGCSKVLA